MKPGTTRITPAEGRSLMDNDNAEIEWLDIPGYEGIYQVSDTGLVRRTKTVKGRRAGLLEGRVIKQGYCCVSLTLNRHDKGYMVHRLVMLAFKGPCPEGMNVNHKNGIKGDNRLENLEYVTHKENVRHSLDVLMCVRANGERNNLSKLTGDKVREIRNLYAQGLSTRALAQMYAVHISNIRLIVYRKTWKHVE